MKQLPRRIASFALPALCALSLSLPLSLSGAHKFNYDSVPGDPLHTLMHTLPNGLRIYMSVNPRLPRIQTAIAVRVGGKNDPAETTGLAHYFEHLMFKGTQSFGTTSYAAEKPMLDRIESLFETYRATSDSLLRADLYRRIDSISYEASKLAIPNEYDKLMSAIGANGTNAYTSTDLTCYIEDIPSNELERWAIVQADRFKNPVIRGFHTELETIYEEKNMSLTNDSRKAYERMLELLFPSHPYGTQTVLGTQTHLKNPSITNIKRYHDTWYVPNNMAVMLAGDFDPDQAVETVARYFGDMVPNPSLSYITVAPEAPITEPLRTEVWGNEAERLTLAWRIPEAANPDIVILDFLSNILSNGSAGLMDLDLKLPQKVLGAMAGLYSMADQGAFIMVGNPLAGQSLDDIEALLLAELEKVRRGDFPESLVEAVKANALLSLEESYITNNNRTSYFIDAFTNGEPWADAVAARNSISSITKDDIVRVANRYLGPSGYVAVSKRQGEPRGELKIAKPQLTPIVTNRDTASAFLDSLTAMPVTPIEPRFTDLAAELRLTSLPGGCQLLYTLNPYNDIFQLTYIYESGSWADKLLPLAARYIKLAGTPDLSPAQIREAFFSLACDYRVSISGRRSFIVLSGLAENMPRAMALLDKLIAQAVDDPQACADFIASLHKSRANAKASQMANANALRSYITYGPDYIKATTLSDAELDSITPAALHSALRNLTALSHRIIYYGPASEQTVINDLETNHLAGRQFSTPAPFRTFGPVTPEENTFYLAPYNAKQLQMTAFANLGGSFDPSLHPILTLYDEYFGGSMNAIVFQELREARSLAYNAWAVAQEPSRLDQPYTFMTQIKTQNDKLTDALDAFGEIIENMPESPNAFNLAKEGIEKRLRTERTVDDNIAWAYISALDRGLDPGTQNLSRITWEALPGLSLQDVVTFQQNHIKGRKYNYGILGKLDELPLDSLPARGRVVTLTPADIFGY